MEIRLLRAQVASAKKDETRLKKLKAKTWKAYTALGRKRVGVKGRAAKTTLLNQYRAKLGKIDAELSEVREEIAQLNERLMEIGEQIAQEAYEASLSDTGESSGATAGDLAAAEASLTAGLDDDIAASRQQEAEAEAGLAQARASGDPQKIIDAINRLNAARDKTASLINQQAGAAESANASQQAVLDQANTRATNAERAAAIGASFWRTIFGSGSIDPASGALNVNINTLHPGDPAIQAEVARWVVGAFGGQGSVPTTNFASAA